MINRFLSVIILMGISLCMMAQKELKINEVFEGKIISSKNKTETHIQGKALESCKLDILRTIKFNAPDNERSEVEKLFRSDIKDIDFSMNDNMEMENRNGMLYYAVVQLSDYRGKHRFVCYQCKKVGEEYKITLAYMRGEATMNELRKMFKK